MRFLGMITVPAGETVGNHDTAEPFSLEGFGSVLLSYGGVGTPDSSIKVEVDDARTFKTSASGVPLANVNGAFLNLPPIGVQRKGDQSTVSVINGTGGTVTVDVYGVWPATVRTNPAV